MKRYGKTIILVALMALPVNMMRAQDTIVEWPSAYYLFEEPNGSPLDCWLIYYRTLNVNNESFSDSVNYSVMDFRRKYIIQDTMLVYGIAWIGTPYDPDEWNISTHHWYFDYRASCRSGWVKRRLQDYVLTLELRQQDGSIQPVDTARFYGDSSYYKNVSDGDSTVVPFYEYYFDAPHTLADTFYVRFSMEDESFRNCPDELAYDFIVFILNSSDYPSTEVIRQNHLSAIPSIQDQELRFELPDGVGLIPILHADRPYCSPVGGLRLEERGEDWARFVWDDAGDSVEYQLVFGHDHTHPVNLYDTRYTISGLDSGRYYDVRLRRVCHHDCPYHTDTVVYGAYSAAVRFWVGSTDPANMGVEAAEADGMEMTVYPNPSGGVVTIGVEHPEGTSLEVRDAVGRTVVRMERIGRETRLDLSLLPRGVYTVTLDSPGGIATRRLVLQ